MPELVHLYIRNILLGGVLALVFTVALVALDVAGLRHLTLETSGGWLALVMLVVFNTILFAGVQFGIAVMRMAEPEDGPRGGTRARRAGRASARQRHGRRSRAPLSSARGAATAGSGTSLPGCVGFATVLRRPALRGSQS